jgi:hypothetical protein
MGAKESLYEAYHSLDDAAGEQLLVAVRKALATA